MKQRKTKTLDLPEWMVDSILDLAKKEKRSFTRQVEVLLENQLKKNAKEKENTHA